MTFGDALEQVAKGHRILRAGWNGKGMHLLYADGGNFKIDGKVMGDLVPFMVMKTADDKFVPWLCSQTDLLASDWLVKP